MTMKCYGCLRLVEPIDRRCPHCGSAIIYKPVKAALQQKNVEDYLRKHAPNTPGLK